MSLRFTPDSFPSPPPQLEEFNRALATATLTPEQAEIMGRTLQSNPEIDEIIRIANERLAKLDAPSTCRSYFGCTNASDFFNLKRISEALAVSGTILLGNGISNRDASAQSITGATCLVAGFILNNLCGKRDKDQEAEERRNLRSSLHQAELMKQQAQFMMEFSSHMNTIDRLSKNLSLALAKRDTPEIDPERVALDQHILDNLIRMLLNKYPGPDHQYAQLVSLIIHRLPPQDPLRCSFELLIREAPHSKMPLRRTRAVTDTPSPKSDEVDAATEAFQFEVPDYLRGGAAAAAADSTTPSLDLDPIMIPDKGDSSLAPHAASAAAATTPSYPREPFTAEAAAQSQETSSVIERTIESLRNRVTSRFQCRRPILFFQPPNGGAQIPCPETTSSEPLPHAAVAIASE